MTTTTKKSEQYLPAGDYWIGDLSYVMGDTYFNEEVYNYNGQGIQYTKAGHAYVFQHTAAGDGVFYDEDGDAYAVDAGNIGIVEVDAIEDDPYFAEGGVFVEMNEAFTFGYQEHGGVITYSDINIVTFPWDYEESY